MTPIIILFLILTACILCRSSLSLTYASLGLELWFHKMIPSLLPFMILSGIMVRLNLTERIAGAVYPVAAPLFRVRKNVVYCMALGFLCGFPMGAKVTADLYERNRITRREAEYLLAFCNNIGPVYFCSFVLPLLNRRLVLPYLFGMYGIPLLYGIFLRHTFFRDLAGPGSLLKPKISSAYGSLHCCSAETDSITADRLLKAVNESVRASLQSMILLGGYMILFNLLNLPFHILLGRKPAILSPLLEITGGLSMLGGSLPLYSLLALSFGGMSCIAQTYSCIDGTDLALDGYICHKIILTLLNGVFYLGWFLLSRSSFLR